MKVYCTQAKMYCILSQFNGSRYPGKACLPNVHWTNTQATVLLLRGLLERLYESVNISSMLYTIIKKTIYMIL